MRLTQRTMTARVTIQESVLQSDLLRAATWLGVSGGRAPRRVALLSTQSAISAGAFDSFVGRPGDDPCRTTHCS